MRNSNFYRTISKKPIYGGAFLFGKKKKAKPTNIMPPSNASFAKESYNLLKVIDVISEGPIEGLSDVDGRVLGVGAPDTINVVPNQEAPNNPLKDDNDFYILKNFPDKFLNQSYKRHDIDFTGRSLQKQRARFPYNVLILIDLSVGAA